jgi:uncharacterized membrane protein YozB (DUF420 family)
MVILNLSLIILTMLPSFHRQVLPKLPGRIARPYFALATAHAALGSVAELTGLYILLAAGTKLLPEKFRITRFKLWMRSLLLLWWIVLFLGMATYARWYADLR